MALITSKFRTSAASGFASTFNTDNIFLVLGRPQPWDNALSTNFSTQASGTVTDSNPPNPIDNYLNEAAFWRDAMAGVKLSASNLRLVTNRNNWQYGTLYDMYRQDISNASPTANSKYTLDDALTIVYVTSTGNVYKCLYNGKTNAVSGVTSTVAPSTVASAAQTTADGYIWKYLYTITSADADFVTANYIPVAATSSVNNVNGIDVAVITSGGSGYSTTPSITIYGDGSGATGTCTLSGTSVSKITMTAVGSGYTWAKIVFNGGGASVTANATAVIAPFGGHGSNNYYETNAHNVMISGTISGYYNQEFPVNQDFRTVGIVKNPDQYVTSQVTSAGTTYTTLTGRILRTLTMSSGATTAPTNDTVLTGSGSGASGLFVFQSSGTIQLQYIQPVAADVPSNISDTSIDTAGTKKLKQFVANETITGTGYSQVVSGNGITAVTPEIQAYSGQLLYLDYRQPVTRSAGQNEKINIVINF
jgi:hypothetical protein